MDTRSAPERIGSGHAGNELADFGWDHRSTALTFAWLRQPCPEIPKAFALPAYDSIGLDIKQGTAANSTRLGARRSRTSDPNLSVWVAISRGDRRQFVFEERRSQEQLLDAHPTATERIEKCKGRSQPWFQFSSNYSILQLLSLGLNIGEGQVRTQPDLPLGSPRS
jgi:hypothetical protein